MTTADELLAWAKQQIGIVIPTPGVSFAVLNSCSLFTSAGYEHFSMPVSSEPSPAWQAGWFQRAGRYGTTPAIGAQIFIDLDGGSSGAQITHTGWVTELGTTLSTIENNAGAHDDYPNGVFPNHRGLVGDNYTLGFGYPPYDIKVAPMYDPALAIRVANELPCPTGGVWLLSPDGAVYSFGGAPFFGGANQPYFATKRAAQLTLANPDQSQWSLKNPPYRIISTDGARYGDGGF